MRRTSILAFIAGRISKILGHDFGLHGIVDKTMPDNHRKITVQVFDDRICLHVYVTYNNVEYKTTHVITVFENSQTIVSTQEYINNSIVEMIDQHESNYFEFYRKERHGIKLSTNMDDFPIELIDMVIGELLA